MAAGPAAAGEAAAAAAAAAVAEPQSTLQVFWPPKHRYAKEAEELVTRFKGLVAEPNDEAHGWTVINNAKDVVVTKKAGPLPLGVLRGEGVIKGYTPYEVFPVTALPACRKIWDELFEDGRPVESIDPCSTLSYAATKGQFPVTGRDFCVLLVNDLGRDGRIFSMSASVVDDKVPPVKSKVRATIRLNGWFLEPMSGEKGTRVVYISEIDLNGWIPDAILKIVAQQMPMVVAEVRKYLMRNGPPPFFDALAGTPVGSPEFDHKSNDFQLKMAINNKLMKTTRILINAQRFPLGAEVTLDPAGVARAEIAPDGTTLTLQHEEDRFNGTQLTIKVKPAADGKAGLIVVKEIAAPAPISVAVTAPGAAAAAASAAVVPAGPPPIDMLSVLPDQIARIERAIARLQTRKRSDSAQTLGLVFLAAVPVIAFAAVRAFA